MNRILALIAVLTLSLAIVTPALADGIIIIDPPPLPPPDFARWLTIRYHRVHVTIEDQVAVTEVDQVFRNDASVAAEGTYVFPLPPGAVVEDFKMWVDGQALEPEILPADEARAIYEGYVRRNQDPALLEYVGRDAVRARIFPIPPRAERRIQLQYSQILPSEDDLMHYRYPLDTERFSARPLEQVSVVVDLTTPVDLGPLYSPTHQDEVVITREGSRRATVSYEASNVFPDRDFELYMGAQTEALGANLLSYKPRSEDGFFLLLLSPSLAEVATETVPRDLLLILDTSGSMDGDKLDQAKAGLTYILRHLNPEDRFNIVAFSSQTRSYAPALVSATEAGDAIGWIAGLEALGGTNIYMALSEALAQVEADRHTTLVFLTDGLPTEGIVDEDVLLNAIEKEAPEDVRVFPLGVGYDVNVLLLDQLAADHRGRPTYIEPDERIDEKVSAFFARMQSPLLTDIRLDFRADGGGSTAEIFDVYPTPLPDLYAGTQLIVAGRYTGGGRQTLTVSGSVNDRDTAFTYGVDFSEHDGAAFIPRLWAARKIGRLLTQIRLHGEDREWIDAVVDLSLRYGIITPYTSFLIEEPERSLTREGRDRAGEAMQDQLAATPAAVSGEQAVDDAKMREELGAAEAPVAGGAYAPEAPAGMPASDVQTIRYVDDKTFVCTFERCTDTAFVPDVMTAEEIAFGTARYRELIAADTTWARYFALAPETIIVDVDGAAYRLLLGDVESLPPEATTAPAAGPTETEPAEPTTPATADVPATADTPPATPAPDQPEAPPARPGLCPAALLLLILPAGAIALKRAL